MALTERLALVLETVGTSAVVRDFDRVGNASQGLAGKLGSIGISAGTLKAGLAGAAAAIGTGLVTLAGKGVDAFTDLAEQIMTVQRVSGASAEDASRLVAVADDLGVSVDKVAGGVFNLGKNIDKLPGLGVALAQDANGATSLTATLVNVADAYVATADPAKRAQLLTAAFGKAGRDLIPIVERGGQGIKDMYAAADAGGLIMSQADLDTARTFSLTMDQLSDTIQAGLVAVGRELVPVLIDFGVVIGKVSEKIGDMNDSLLGKGIGLFLKYGTSIGQVASLLDILAGEEGDARESAMKADAAFREQTEAVDELSKVTLAASSAQRAYDASARAVTTADRSLTKARKEYNELLREGAVDEEKVVDARRSLDDATRSLAASQRNLRERQEEYNEALAYSGAVGGDTAMDRLEDASDNLADANDGVAAATDRQREASKDLARAQAGDPEFNDKLAEAKRGVTDAEQNFADAQHASSQKAYELDTALSAQNTTIATNAGQVATLRSEWESLIALKPEIAEFLEAPLGALANAAPAAAGPAALGPTVVAPPGPGMVSQEEWERRTRGWGGTTAADLRSAQEIHIHVDNPTNADPTGLAKAIIWELR